MAISLPKYKQQIRISGEGTAKPIDPSLTIKAAGAEDQLIGEIIESAGGIASEYFEKKSETIDQGLLADYELQKAETEKNIIVRTQDALLGRNEFEDNTLTMEEINNQVVQDELNKLEIFSNNLNINFNKNKDLISSDFANFNSKINQSQLLSLNKREIQESNYKQFNLLQNKEAKLFDLENTLDIYK